MEIMFGIIFLLVLLVAYRLGYVRCLKDSKQWSLGKDKEGWKIVERAKK